MRDVSCIYGRSRTHISLETTPAGREWPLPRDIRGLAIAGLRARAAHNRQLTTAENVRTALLVGVAAYLAYNAAAVVGFYVRTGLLNDGPHLRPLPVDWISSRKYSAMVRPVSATRRRLPGGSFICP